MEQSTTLADVVKKVFEATPAPRAPFDALFLLTHCCMEYAGFRVVGFGEEGNQLGSPPFPSLDSCSPRVMAVAMCASSPSFVGCPVDNPLDLFFFVYFAEEKNLTEDWHKSDDAWAFRYRHSQSSMTFLLKVFLYLSSLSCVLFIYFFPPPFLQ